VLAALSGRTKPFGPLTDYVGDQVAYFVRLTIGGLRGFARLQSLDFAQPNGTPGSGLTLLVGANNSGKSTIIESLRALSQSPPPSFSQGRRNRAFGDRVMIRLCGEGEGHILKLESVRSGGSEVTMDGSIESGSLFVVQSRRSFSPLFSGYGGVPGDRGSYLSGYQAADLRLPTVESLALRLFTIDRDNGRRVAFQKLMSKVIDPPPEWTIDRSDNGQYFLKYRWPGLGGVDSDHSSEGLGDGLTSLLSIIDALYDSEPSTMTVIDEPELSLHPEYQRRLAALLVDLSRDRQIVCATHSPYFISWEAIGNGACVVRMRRSADGCQAHAASRDSLQSVADRCATETTRTPSVSRQTRCSSCTTG
jgi:energy-coupling factor transporter ATP-binding protein EcfA2